MQIRKEREREGGDTNITMTLKMLLTARTRMKPSTMNDFILFLLKFQIVRYEKNQ